ncbi:unnamed protein product [Durusdinium trenchii]|uniref:Uncharacterized protein n=2 Tax=Durusdinium trenchii TaxID=1381693 RepID=A0ABP0HUC2_9DINO
MSLKRASAACSSCCQVSTSPGGERTADWTMPAQEEAISFHRVLVVPVFVSEDGAASVVLMLVLQYVCDPVSSASQDSVDENDQEDRNTDRVHINNDADVEEAYDACCA